jgi:hypothetical protein
MAREPEVVVPYEIRPRGLAGKPDPLSNVHPVCRLGLRDYISPTRRNIEIYCRVRADNCG